MKHWTIIWKKKCWIIWKKMKWSSENWCWNIVIDQLNFKRKIFLEGQKKRKSKMNGVVWKKILVVERIKSESQEKLIPLTRKRLEIMKFKNLGAQKFGVEIYTWQYLNHIFWNIKCIWSIFHIKEYPKSLFSCGPPHDGFPLLHTIGEEMGVLASFATGGWCGVGWAGDGWVSHEKSASHSC